MSTTGSKSLLANSGTIDITHAIEWYFGQAGFMYDESERTRKDAASAREREAATTGHLGTGTTDQVGQEQ